MKVEHTTLSGYFEDLELAAKKYNHTLVRNEVVQEKKNEGIDSVYVVSGFHDEHYVYELKYDCGEILLGGSNQPLEDAHTIVDVIMKKCKEVGVPFGGGQWHL